jgi:hypothetical protein
MRFFAIVGFTLFLIAMLNLVYVSVEIAGREPVYACSEVTKTDPLDVRKRCRK